MDEQEEDTARDEVLFAFHQQCERPSAEDVIAWAERYPQFADDIRAHAAIRRDWAARVDESDLADDDVLLARGRSDALNILHKAQGAAQQKADTPTATFDAMMAAKSLDIPQVAAKIGIARGVLSALFGGRMDAPVGARLIAALQGVFGISRTEFDTAFSAAINAPRLGLAKANESASIPRQGYDAIIRDSSMTDDVKAHWLGED